MSFGWRWLANFSAAKPMWLGWHWQKTAAAYRSKH